MPHPLLIAARIVPYGGGRAQAPVAADDIGLNLVAGTTASFNILANDQRVDDADVTLGTLTGPIVTAPPNEPKMNGPQLQVTATSGTGAWSQAYQVATTFGVSSAVASGTVQPAPTSASIVYQWELNDGFLNAQIPATGGISGSVTGSVAFGQPTIPTSATGKGVAMNGSGHIEIPDPGSVAVPGVFQKAAFGVSFYAQVGALATVGTASQLVHKDATFQLGGLAIEYSNVSGVNRLDPYLRDANGVARRFAAPVGTERNLGINQSFLVAFTCDPALAAGSRCKLYLRRQGEAATVLDTPVATSLTDESAIIGLVQNAVDWVLGAYNASTGGMTGALQRVMFWDGAPSPTQLKALTPPTNNITITYPQAVPAPVPGTFSLTLTSAADFATIDPTQSPSLNAGSATVTIVSETVTPGDVSIPSGTHTIRVDRPAGNTAAGSGAITYRLTNPDTQTATGTINVTVQAKSTGTSYTPRTFVTTSNPAVNHTGLTARPTFTPSDPMLTSFTDPMAGGSASGIRIVRVGGSLGETVYTWRDNTQRDAGCVFPKRALTPENLGTTHKVWNADSTLLMIDKRFSSSTGEPTNGCSSYLVDVTGQYLGNTKAWRIIRASTKHAVGDAVPGADWWAWDPQDPLRAYAWGSDGRVYEWFPVGTATETVGRVREIWGPGPAGYTSFLSSGHRPHILSQNGLYVMMGCKNPSGYWGGLRRNLSNGSWGSFCSSLTAKPHIPLWADDEDQLFKDTPGRAAGGLSSLGTYTMFVSLNQFCFLNAATGAYVGDTQTDFGHHDWAMVDGVEYCTGPKNGYRMWRLAASNDAPNKGSFPVENPSHATCRNIKDLIETYHPGTGLGGSSSGLRYAIFSRSRGFDGDPPSIMGIRLGANDFNVVRYICNHRSERGSDTSAEAHPTVSPNGRYVAFNSNWRYANSSLSTQCHAYVAILPDAWYSPNNNGS